MKVYTVHEPGNPASDRLDRAETLVFVSDGFDWPAALFAPFRLAGSKLWTGLVIYVAALAAASALLSAIGASAGWITLALLALHVIAGFEYNELRRTSLDAAGWTNVGTITGRNRAECERRFFDNWLDRQPMLAGLRTHREPAPHPADLPAIAAPAQPKSKWRPW